MKEELVSFETAKLLKEKGFSKISGFMGWVDKFYHPRTGSILSMGRTGKCKFSDLYYAPTQSLAQKWLREKHGIHIAIMPATIPSNEIKYYVYKGKKSWDWNELHNTYEEALEEGLRVGLDLIK